MSRESRADIERRIMAGAGIVASVAIGVAAAIRMNRALRERRRVRRGNPTGEAPIRSPQSGDILLFFRPNRLRDCLIELATGSKFYHAALWSGGGKVLEARPQGVGETGLEGREGEYIVLPAPDGRGAEALAWAKTQIGAPFDMNDIIAIGLEHIFRVWKINYTRPGYYTCAELVADAYRHAGIELIPGTEPGDIAPGDLARLIPVDEGKRLRPVDA